VNLINIQTGLWRVNRECAVVCSSGRWKKRVGQLSAIIVLLNGMTAILIRIIGCYTMCSYVQEDANLFLNIDYNSIISLGYYGYLYSTALCCFIV
jgi:hypothetical protein